MKFTETAIDGLFLVKPDIFEDERGTFRRNFCVRLLAEVNIPFEVCQGNISENSKKHTMRGFHYQKGISAESKVMTAVTGSFHNVVIDLRPNSPTYLRHVDLEISASRRESVIVPANCANAFLTLQDNTIIQYYMGDYFNPDSYSGFSYDDPFFNIKWPYAPAVISPRDREFKAFDPKYLVDF